MQQFGLHWEIYALAECQKRGYGAKLMPHFFECYDILLEEILPVEVKASRPSRRWVRPGYSRPRWIFDLRGGLNPRKEIFLYILIAVAQDIPYLYLVPSWLMRQRQSVTLTSHPLRYGGYLTADRDNWAIVGWRLAERRRALGLGGAKQLTLWEAC